MKILNYSEFRANLKEHLDSVEKENEIVIIKRGDSSGAVLISLEEYNSIQESLHLVSSGRNREWITASIKQLLQRQEGE